MFRPNATPQEVASWCEKEFGRAYQARTPLERQWLLNLAFYYGKQWSSWGPNPSLPTATLREPMAQPWRVRLTVNKIQPYVRREVARLSSQRPRGYVMPASSEESDRAAARVAENVYEYLHEDLSIDAAHDLADWWASICGCAYYKVRFIEEVDPSSNQMGRMAVDVVRPFDLYVADLEETRIREQIWVCQVQAIQKQKLQEMFPKAQELTPDNNTPEVDGRIRNVMSIFNQSKGDDYVVVKEFWFKPTRDYPYGLVCAVANGKLLEYEVPKPPTPEEMMAGEADPMAKMAGYHPEVKKPRGTIDWPYGHGRLPFIPRGHTMSGRFYDQTFIDQIISPQREYNRSRSQIIENKNLTSRPQWAIPIGSVDKAQLTTEPGNVIEFTPGFNPPQPITPPPLPNYVMEHIKVTSQEMDEIASQNEVSKGSVPPGVEAATAIAYLQEKDDSALTYAIRNKERACQEIARQLLALVVQFWDVERMIRVVGQNELYDARLLKGSDLRDNVDYRIVPGSGTPISRAAQHAEILEMVKTGLLPASKGLRFLNMPDIDALIKEVEVDIVEACKENLKMSRGEYAMVYIWQDHVAHLDEHDSFKKHEEYTHLDDNVKAYFAFHDYQHMTQLATLFNIPIPPESPEVQAQRMGSQQVDPMTGQVVEVPGNPFAIDTMVEIELRKIFVMLKSGGGAPPPAEPTGPPPE